MTDMDVKVVSESDSSEIFDAEGFEHHILDEKAVEKKNDVVSTQVKMKFPNFAKLVATHSFENVLEKNANEDIVLSADLLADLANAEPMEDDKRKQVYLVVGGIIFGLILGFLFLGNL